MESLIVKVSSFLYEIVTQQFGKFCTSAVPNQIQFVQLSNNRKSYAYI